MGYKTRILAVAEAIHAYSVEASDDKRFELRKNAIVAIQAVYSYLATSMKVEKMTAQKLDFYYISDIQTIRKVDKENRTIILNQRSLTAIQGLIEDCVYFRLNNIKIPRLNLSKAAINFREQEEKQKAAEAAKEAAKNIVKANAKKREELQPEVSKTVEKKRA